jgi:hypothetical protein
MNTAPLVSVVIVNWNGGALLEACLRSVFAQPYRPMEVILVDNGSTDGSAAAAAALRPEIRLLPLGTNAGFAEGCNRGTAAACGEYVVLLNNDTEVEEGWIPGLLEHATDPAVGAVTSRVVTDGHPASWYEMNGSVNYLGYNIMRVFSDLSMVFFGGGASLMFHRERTGTPFPAEYFLYHEDVHLSWRLRLAGREIRLAQNSGVRHRGSAGTQRQPGRLVTFYQERNRLLNTLVFFGPWTLMRLLPYLVADALAKTLLAVAAGRKSLRGILEAYLWIGSHAGWLRRERARMQALRRVPDREVLALMSSRIVDSDSGAARVVNALSAAYARLTGLAPGGNSPGLRAGTGGGA